MPDFAPAMPHGPITEVFPDVFLVTGSFRFAPGLTITRNMTIVREGRELTIVNTVRLSPEGEAELARLGDVKHVMRLGAFHGLDDPYYVARYKPAFWAPPGTRHHGDLPHDRDLLPGNSPMDDLCVFGFAAGRQPEVALILEREGGILLTCDAYQNWTTLEGCSFLGKIMMKLMGFGPLHIGTPWLKAMGSGVRADFERLAERQFVHLIPGHGTVLKDTAKEGLRIAMARCLK